MGSDRTEVRKYDRCVPSFTLVIVTSRKYRGSNSDPSVILKERKKT